MWWRPIAQVGRCSFGCPFRSGLREAGADETNSSLPPRAVGSARHVETATVHDHAAVRTDSSLSAFRVTARGWLVVGRDHPGCPFRSEGRHQRAMVSALL